MSSGGGDTTGEVVEEIGNGEIYSPEELDVQGSGALKAESWLTPFGVLPGGLRRD